MTRRSHLTLSIVAALVLAPFGVAAQQRDAPGAASSTEAPSEDSDATDLDAVRVVGRAQRLYRVEDSSLATRTDTPLELVPQSVQVINRDLIDDQGAHQVTDLYRNISGISFFSYAGVVLRGFRQENVLYDGLRGDPYAGFSVPQLFNIERVEVLKGPAGAAYGSGDPGGVINYATRKPTALPERQLRLEAGNFDYGAASLEASGPLDAAGRVRYRVGVHVDHEQGFRNNTSQDSLIGDVGFAFDVGDTGELLLQYTDLQQDLDANRLRGVPASDDGVFLTDREWNTNEPTDYLELDARIGLARYTAAPTDALDVSLAVRWFENAERQQYHESRGIAADGRTVWREFRDQARDVEGLATAGHAALDITTGSIAHTLLFGGEMSQLDAYFIGRTAGGVERGGPVPGLDLFDPVYGLSGGADYGLDTLPFRPATRTRSRQDGLYLQDQMDLGRWHLLAGLRWDRFEDKDRVAGTAIDGNDLTWRMGTTFEATDAVNLYASMATGFSPQSAGSQNPLAGGPFDPERSRQWELGAKSSLAGGRITLNAAVYRIERSNVVQGTGEDAGNDGVDDLAALGLVRSDGFELDLLADLTERWVLNLAYGYNDARVLEGDPAAAGNTTGDSDRFANAPRHKLGLWTRYDLPAIASSIALGVDHVGDRVSLEGQAVKAYTIFDASWQTQWRDWTFQANVKNLFDKVYAASGFIERTGHFPGEPRRLYLQARYRF
ncbi:TonB-dependent siderophore receptor [Luteimonas saliphila]|uniref:TonB-dependent siderophore receptor n=1 Tax=Luteimonas saliphila TaxID=2804919 RepID=UPI00192D4D63|nr:TonB-dependent receptor [Luteimonas saliphila]